jgi:hypothetical protein
MAALPEHYRNQHLSLLAVALNVLGEGNWYKLYLNVVKLWSCYNHVDSTTPDTTHHCGRV